MTSNNCGIYKITNTVDGKFYIGSSCNITKRFWSHRSLLIHDKHYNRHLQSAWNKYGAQAFTFETVLLCDIETKLYFEQVFIDALCPAYNFAKGALATMQGYKHTEETRRKVGEAHKGKTQSVEARAKISESLFGNTRCVGHKHTEETKRKMSEASKGRALSEESRHKVSEKLTGRTLSEEHRQHLIGRVFNEETRRRMSEASKLGIESGTHRQCSAEHMRRMIDTNKGTHRSEETKRKLSEALKRYWAERKANV